MHRWERGDAYLLDGGYHWSKKWGTVVKNTVYMSFDKFDHIRIGAYHRSKLYVHWCEKNCTVVY